MTDAERVPVILGVGQINDRADEMDSFALMRAALEAADADGGGGWLKQLQSLAVVDQLSFAELTDIPERLAEAFGAAPRILAKTKYPSGESPVLLLNEAAERIRGGEIEIAAVVGGEALRTAAKRAKASAGKPDFVRESAARVAQPLRVRHGLVAPTDVYPLYENASRAASGQSLAEGQRESADIWSRFSEVAAGNEHAWLRRAMSAEEILAVSADNRPIAFPYTKYLVANQSVNQGAGFIVASLAKARAMGVSDERIVYVGYGAAAREPSDVLARESYTRSIALETSLRKALEFNALTVADLDCVELYSCFPCIPKFAWRAIGWPLDKPMSVVGGLTFGGGPVGNYMSHAIAAMTERLRSDGRAGLLFGNGGFANTNHCIVLTRDAPRAEPRSFDVQADADAQRGPAPSFIESYSGAASVETYTVFYDREGAPRFAAVVGRTPEGARFLARVERDDASAIGRLTSASEEAVGAAGASAQHSDGLNRWQFT